MIIQTLPGMRGTFRSAFSVILIAALILAFCLYLQTDTPLKATYEALRETQNTLIGPLSKPKHVPAKQYDYETILDIQAFWGPLHEILISTKPPTNPLKPTTLARLLPPNETSSGELPDLIPLIPTEIRTIKHAHERFIKAITSDFAPQLVYKPSTRGIVTTAGTSYLSVLLISLRMLRRTGCMLPVEVFVSNDQDRLGNICQEKLPALNAQCLDVSYLLGTANPIFLTENRYLNKLLAMLFSSFDDLLFLDSDNLPVLDPAHMLTSAPFTITGLVGWSDFWNSTTSPRYYDIASIPLEDTIDGTVESGQLLLSKSKHASTLLLAMYYNFHGKSHYYPLLSQGGHGEGDKDTFLPAALALNQSFYFVDEPAGMVGQWENGKFQGVGMVQYDPIQDSKRARWRDTHPKPVVSVRPRPGEKQTLSHWVMEDDKRKPKIAFVHHHMPKLKPSKVFGKNSPTKDADGKPRRIWGKLGDVVDRFDGVDVEHAMWKEVCEVACELEEDGKRLGAANTTTPTSMAVPTLTGTTGDRTSGSESESSEDGDESEENENENDDGYQGGSEGLGQTTWKRSERWWKDLKNQDADDEDTDSLRVCWKCRNYMKVIFHEDGARGNFFKGS